ncbi:MAG: hypothetical protein LBB26_01880 [Puniceicoccales bacterium]|jgi:hypothetical protein|nr:hypothetical protein [Puniceicoccales bacterium]
MKNVIVTATTPADIFDGDLELQMPKSIRLTPGFKLKPSFLREFPSFLERASPLPAAKAIQRISSMDKKTKPTNPIGKPMKSSKKLIANYHSGEHAEGNNSIGSSGCDSVFEGPNTKTVQVGISWICLMTSLKRRISKFEFHNRYFDGRILTHCARV